MSQNVNVGQVNVGPQVHVGQTMQQQQHVAQVGQVHMASSIIDNNAEKKKPRKSETEPQRRERMNARNARDKELRERETPEEKAERCKKRREADNQRHNKVPADPGDVDDRKKRRREKDKERRGAMDAAEKEAFNAKRRENHKKRKEKQSAKDSGGVETVPAERSIQPANIDSLQAYVQHTQPPAAIPGVGLAAHPL